MNNILLFLSGLAGGFLFLSVLAPRVSWLRKRTIYDEIADVRDMHHKFGFLAYELPGHVTRRLLNERIQCMREELDEFAEAVENQDLAGQADALIDLVYFAKGTAVMLGVPWEKLWDDVHRANMAKIRGVGKRGHQADLVKPTGWEPPNTAAILFMESYHPDDWGRYSCDMFGNEHFFCDETKCRDYPAFKGDKP